MKQTSIVIALGTILALTLLACGTKSNQAVSTGKTIKSVPVGSLTATLSNESGAVNHGDQEVMLSFTDAAGKPEEAKAARERAATMPR